MKRALSIQRLINACVAVSLVGVSGCGAVDPRAGSSVRSARQTCRAGGFDELSIDSAFDATRINRDAGFTELEHVLSALADCEGVRGFGCPQNPNIGPDFTVEQCIVQCVSCAEAVAREVYAGS